MDLTDELTGLAERHSHQLGAVAWPSEVDRWAELVFCLVNACMADEAPEARKVVDALGKVGVLVPERLSRAVDPDSSEATVVRYVLGAYGVADSDLARTTDALGRVATATQEIYAGKLQRYLRAKGQEIRDELVEAFSVPEDELSDVRRGVTHWLQNALSLPVAVDDVWVRDFLMQRDSSLGDLEEAADAGDVNLALVDDLIRLHGKAQAGAS